MSDSSLNKVATHPIQTAAWRDFRKEWGNEVIEFPFGIITVHKIPLTPFKVAIFDKGILPTAPMLRELKDYAKKHNIIFIKLEPNIPKKGNEKVISLLRKKGAVEGKTLFTPTTFYIDLKKDEEKLLESFSSKTRYNIRLSERKGVKVQEDNSEKAFNTYLKLLNETTKRQGFYAHSERYHRLMWKHLQKAGIAHLLLATYQKETLVAWIIFKWKDFIYYPYGSSSDSHKNVMAPNLMMWEAIKWGKKNKAKTFDLWGREEGKGFTKFKEGYNPTVFEFLGTWDLVCSPLYTPYLYMDKLRWFILRARKKLHI